ncbi:MAG: META domain-containing protein [Acetobacteraceae bacterium]|jgi:putative lipoprotein|nr:META domain-containing protein [Acetobacteraceae bacterium]
MRGAVPRRLFSVGVLAMTSVHACAAEPASPQGAWVAEEIGGATPVPGEAASLEIGADGAVSGSTGCNRFRGRAEIGTGTLTFSPLATTRMACPGPAMEQERRFLEALAASRRYRVEAGMLTLLGADGGALARFRRGV